MKNIFVVMLFLLAAQAQANTYGVPYEVFPHGGTGVNAHDRVSPANATTTAAVANGHGYINTVQQATSQSGIPNTAWTYYTFDVVFRINSPVSYGYVHFWRQNC